jgi:hypothetical protein
LLHLEKIDEIDWSLTNLFAESTTPAWRALCVLSTSLFVLGNHKFPYPTLYHTNHSRSPAKTINLLKGYFLLKAGRDVTEPEQLVLTKLADAVVDNANNQSGGPNTLAFQNLFAALHAYFCAICNLPKQIGLSEFLNLFDEVSTSEYPGHQTEFGFADMCRFVTDAVRVSAASCANHFVSDWTRSEAPLAFAEQSQFVLPEWLCLEQMASSVKPPVFGENVDTQDTVKVLKATVVDLDARLSQMAVSLDRLVLASENESSVSALKKSAAVKPRSPRRLLS